MSLTRAELVISGRWHGREYTTDPPRYVPFTVWSLDFEIACELPIRLVHLLNVEQSTLWGLAHGSEHRQSRSVSASFRPESWMNSDGVHVVFGSSKGAWVADSAFKADPRPLVEVRHPEVATGQVTELAAIPRHGITLGVIALAHDDTEDRRLSKWRVRPNLKDALPEHLHGLVSGYQSGETTR